jgi:methionine synthase II (cobalamin-independent)
MTITASDHTRPGASFGVGSLPHRSLAAALDFVWSSTAMPTISTLPRRSPAEAMVPQALVGITGVSVGQYSGIAVDLDALDIDAPVDTDLSADAFGSFAAFLETFESRRSAATTHVKWQFVGPVTLALALERAGVAPEIALPLALRAVRGHVSALQQAVTDACGDVTQVIVLDEPSFADALEPGSGLEGVDIVDTVSGALASVDSRNIAGVHSCARTDWGALLATGAQLLSVPVPSPNDGEAKAAMVDGASRIADHLDHGGRIAWGAVRTDGPVPNSAERPWKNLMEAMCDLVRAGVDPLALRKRCFVTPDCGLASHSESSAARVMSIASEVGERVRQQSTASRLTLGS